MNNHLGFPFYFHYYECFYVFLKGAMNYKLWLLQVFFKKIFLKEFVHHIEETWRTIYIALNGLQREDVIMEWL
jgi:hypothetical protein